MGPGYQPSNETAGYPVFEPIGYIDQDGRLKVKHQNDGTMMYHVTMLHLENTWKAAVITYNYERFDRILAPNCTAVWKVAPWHHIHFDLSAMTYKMHGRILRSSPSNGTFT